MMISEAEKHYKKLAEIIPRTLESRIHPSEHHEDYIKKLNSVHQKHKEIFVNMNRVFFKLTKKAFEDGTIKKPKIC